ncbi:MAG TPA: response regulator [Coleofasciculaceae cyanobacterium]|jgi:CheY-like chemotaxis protein
MNKILIIEDERETRDIFIEALTEEGFEAISAKNGRVGIQKTQKYFPDLIICDVTMPELNGYGVLKILRQDPRTAAIPFIFMSALSDEAERHEAMRLGANDYLTKPCTVEKLLQAIANFSNSIDRQQI